MNAVKSAAGPEETPHDPEGKVRKNKVGKERD